MPRWMDERMDVAMRPSEEACQRARALLAQGDLAGAEAECRKAVALSPIIRTPTDREGKPFNFSAVKLLGEIYLRRGKNREALQCFLGAHPHMVGGGLNFKAVVAYCRLGEYQNAKRFYSEESLLSNCPWVVKEDLPGSRDLASLEASALLWLGIDADAEDRLEDALRDFLRAEQLVPNNPLIAYSMARTLMILHRGEEALPRYRLAASAGHGRIAEEARRKVKAIEHWFRLHPPAASGNAP